MTKKPVHEIRLGSVKATIWCNETGSGPRHNVRITRLYKTDDGDWKSTDSFGRDELPLVEKVSSNAHEWIFKNAQQSTASSE